MERITRDTIRKQAVLAARSLGLPGDAIWPQHSASGWTVFLEAGPNGAASPLGECLSAREALSLLRGVEMAPRLSERWSNFFRN
jgi:hypothetical protein